MSIVKIRVDTFHLSDLDEIESSRDIDHGRRSDREWLEKHVFWALRNERGVEITPLVEIQ